MAQIIFGASDGIRTRDGRNHNPGLYQLSYARHRSPRKLYRKVIRDARFGAPGGTRTPDRRIRNPLLYPAELRAHGGPFAARPSVLQATFPRSWSGGRPFQRPRCGMVLTGLRGFAFLSWPGNLFQSAAGCLLGSPAEVAER